MVADCQAASKPWQRALERGRPGRDLPGRDLPGPGSRQARSLDISILGAGFARAGILGAGFARAGILGACLLGACLVGGCDPDQASETPLSYADEIEAWHADRVEALRSPTGWLSLIGLHPLEAGARRVGSGPRADIRLPDPAPAEVGMFTVGKDRIAFAAHPSARVVLYATDDLGREATLPTRGLPIVTDAGGDPTVLGVGTLRFHVIERGRDRFVRVKDTASKRLEQFDGIERFPVDESWRIQARLVPAAGGQTVSITNSVGQIHESPTPGHLEFEAAGTACRLTPTGSPGEALFIAFGDASNGDETYGGGRFLSAAAPDSSGVVLLDFNRATNPPCVFTPFATCPLPPAENVLPIAVRAGEKTWAAGH
jgi:uncharacterized protein